MTDYLTIPEADFLAEMVAHGHQQDLKTGEGLSHLSIAIRFPPYSVAYGALIACGERLEDVCRKIDAQDGKGKGITALRRQKAALWAGYVEANKTCSLIYDRYYAIWKKLEIAGEFVGADDYATNSWADIRTARREITDVCLKESIKARAAIIAEAKAAGIRSDLPAPSHVVKAYEDRLNEVTRYWRIEQASRLEAFEKTRAPAAT